MAQFQRKPHLIIDNLKTLQVVSHPLRAQLLDHFDVAPQTVKQVAHRMGMTANKLYYHVNMLEEHGLLALIKTRTVGNMLERLYQTAAERFEIAADLLSFSTHEGQERAEQVVVASLDATRQDLLRSMEARRLQREQGGELCPSQAVVGRVVSRLTQEQADAFRKRLCDLMEQFGQADLGAKVLDDDSAAVETYALGVAYYASFDFPEQNDE
jgi:hypothetical protein